MPFCLVARPNDTFPKDTFCPCNGNGRKRTLISCLAVHFFSWCIVLSPVSFLSSRPKGRCSFYHAVSQRKVHSVARVLSKQARWGSGCPGVCFGGLFPCSVNHYNTACWMHCWWWRSCVAVVVPTIGAHYPDLSHVNKCKYNFPHPCLGVSIDSSRTRILSPSLPFWASNFACHPTVERDGTESNSNALCMHGRFTIPPTGVKSSRSRKPLDFDLSYGTYRPARWEVVVIVLFSLLASVHPSRQSPQPRRIYGDLEVDSSQILQDNKQRNAYP